MRLGTALALSLLLLPASAGAQTETIQPGDQVSEKCTLGWLFDGSDGAAYFSTAGHCFDLGAPVTTGGKPLGKVTLRGADDSEAGQDVALIRVDSDLESRLAGAMRGHPDIPSGITSPVDALPGDPLQISGWGMGVDGSPATRENRAGEFVRGDEWFWSGASPIINGDSGGPVAHLVSGTAFGLNKGHGCVIRGGAPLESFCGSAGPSIAAIERVAEEKGITLTLRLAGQPAPPKPRPAPAQPKTEPSPGTPPAGEPAPAAKKKPSAKAACKKKAKKIKNKRKRRAALKRCAKKR